MAKGKRGRERSFEEKMTRRFLILFAALFVAVFLWDGFVRHPIPAPEGTFRVTDGAEWRFDLFQRDVRYSDSECLDSNAYGSDVQIYLVRSGEEVHLLVFETHFITLRTGMIKDLVIDPMEQKTYRVPVIWGSYRITVSDGKIQHIGWLGLQNRTNLHNSPILRAYLFTAAALAAVDNILYRKVWRRKRSGGEDGKTTPQSKIRDF